MKVCAVLIVVLVLSGCYMPAPYVPPPPPIEYSFTDPSKPLYPQTAQGARQFLKDVRDKDWYHYDDRFVQQPKYSLISMSGDCVDFAVMLAAYIQWHWGYDTLVLLLTDVHDWTRGHAVCSVRRTDFPQTDIEDYRCSDEPFLRHEGESFRPLDWRACPSWTWDDYDIGGLAFDYDGWPHYLESIEWFEAFHYRMSVR